MSTTSPPLCLDLFAGCGGLTEGLLQAGIDVIASVELHPQAALTHAFNHPGTSVLVGDVRSLDYGLVDRELEERGAAQLDLVVGGPPCQGFSSAGKKKQFDPRNSLFLAYANVVAAYRPRMFLLENVPGFQTMFGGSTYRQAVDTFRELGYETTDHVLSARDFGVPQTRRRFVLVGWLPDDAKPFELSPTGQLEVSAYDALSDIDFVEPGFVANRYRRSKSMSPFAAERRANSAYVFNHLATRHRDRAVRMMTEIAEGGSIRDVDPTIRSAKRTMSRIDRRRLAGTVLSLPDDMIHYKHHRILTVRESARLQTFDDDFVFFGKRTSGYVERRVDVPQYTQVGNAVPPLLAKALGHALTRSLGHEERLLDLRDLGERRARQTLVRGTSGWSGYALDPSAEGLVRLRTVSGAEVPVPTYRDEELVVEQRGYAEWSASDRPRRSQWAPGVDPKGQPSWHASQ